MLINTRQARSHAEESTIWDARVGQYVYIYINICFQKFIAKNDGEKNL